MTGISGFCLKCKTYGPIKDGKMIVMNNGRTRCAGFVLNQVVLVKLYLKPIPIRIYRIYGTNYEGSWSRL